MRDIRRKFYVFIALFLPNKESNGNVWVELKRKRVATCFPLVSRLRVCSDANRLVTITSIRLILTQSSRNSHKLGTHLELLLCGQRCKATYFVTSFDHLLVRLQLVNSHPDNHTSLVFSLKCCTGTHSSSSCPPQRQMSDVSDKYRPSTDSTLRQVRPVLQCDVADDKSQARVFICNTKYDSTCVLKVFPSNLLHSQTPNLFPQSRPFTAPDTF